jgi:hypothetical protein
VGAAAGGVTCLALCGDGSKKVKLAKGGLVGAGVGGVATWLVTELRD